MSSLPDDFSRSQLKDRSWKGDGIQVNKDIAKKPTDKNRRCTDVLCCLVFVAFMVGMIWSTVYGYVNGNPGKLIAPIDGDKNICGYSAGVEDYPKLYIDDISTAASDPTNVFSYSVCVKSCPKEKTDAIDCQTTSVTKACTPEPGQEYTTTDFINYCIPVYDSLPQEAKDNWNNVKNEINKTSYGGAFADLYEARWVLLLASGLCLVTTMIYIKFMDWCAYWLSWLSVVLVFAALVGSGIWTLTLRANAIEKDPSYEDESGAMWLNFYAYSAFIAAGIYLLVMICCFQSLRVAIAVIETAADYFADTKRIIFVPMLYFFIGILCFVGWVGAMICVSSIGEIEVSNIET